MQNRLWPAIANHLWMEMPWVRHNMAICGFKKHGGVAANVRSLAFRTQQTGIVNFKNIYVALRLKKQEQTVVWVRKWEQLMSNMLEMGCLCFRPYELISWSPLDIPSGVIKHGKLGNPLQMHRLNPTSSDWMVDSPLPRVIEATRNRTNHMST